MCLFFVFQGFVPIRPTVQHPDEVHRRSDSDAQSQGPVKRENDLDWWV